MTCLTYVFHGVTWAGGGHFLSAILTPLIGGIVAYIAWQQFTVNRRQHLLALFEKRLAVFNSTMKMIASVNRDANADLNQCFQFIRDTRDHEFLFRKEVGDYINEVYHKAVALHAKNQMASSAALEITQTMEWFIQQSKEAKNIFLKYMDFREP